MQYHPDGCAASGAQRWIGTRREAATLSEFDPRGFEFWCVPFGVAYQASKHGVLGVMRCAAMYGGPLGIRVNAVAPGLVPTELFAAQKTARGGGNDMAQRGTTVPLRRTGTPEEIAAVVIFLLSDDASYVHGEVISVDGGSAIVSTVRPAGGAGAWDTEAVDRRPELARWRQDGREDTNHG